MPKKIEEVLEDFNSTIGARDTKWLQDDKSLEKASDYFFKNLKKLGYNAVVDYNDTVGGSAGMGNNPMILLDAKNTVKKLSESKIRTLDQLSALDAEVESIFKMQGEYGEYLYEKYLGGIASNVDSFMGINVNPYLEAFGKKTIPQINDHYEEIGKAMADTVLTAKGAVKSIEEMTIPALAGTLLGANIGRQLANVSNKEKENQKDAEELNKINEELKKRK